MMKYFSFMGGYGGRWQKAKISCLSILVFILTVEVSARVDDKIKFNAPIFGLYSPSILRTSDSEGINCNVPNAHFEKWRINRFGFRGEDIPQIKPGGVTRIICMGTSETFGLYESPGQEWPNQLNDMLEESKHFQVINSSVVGLPLKKYRRYLEKYVFKLEPDVIILYLNPFDYAVGAEKFANRQSLFQRGMKEGKTEENSFIKNLSSNLRILPKLKQVLKGMVPDRILKRYQLWDLKKQIHHLEYIRLNGSNPIDSISRENLDSFQNDLEELIKFLLQRKIEVILSTYPVLITPENFNRHPEVFLDHRRFYVEVSLSGIIDASKKFNGILEKVAGNERVAFIDINSAIPKNTNYFSDNVHYTNEGAKLVASFFATYIRSRLVD